MKENCKIAVIAYTTFSTDTRVQKEANAAAEAGYSLDIYTLDDENVSDYSNFNFKNSHILQYKGQSKLKYSLSYVKFFLFCLFSLSLNFLKSRYKYVHIHNMPNFLVFAALVPRLLGSKIILDIHDLMPEIFSVKFKLPRSHSLIKMLYAEERLSAKFANKIIATNKFHIERFKENKIDNGKITEIINVADNKVFYPPENKNFYSEKLYLAYPSTLAKRLGIDDLIEAVEILNKKGLNIFLNIYGDGEYRADIIKNIKEKKLDHVITLTNSFISLEQLSLELDKAHIGIIPLPSNLSNDIAMPVKMYEFFAKKVCVVASDLPLMKTCFNSSVVFFAESNAEDLALKLEYLYKNRDDLADFAERGYNKFMQETWDFYKERYKLLIN